LATDMFGCMLCAELTLTNRQRFEDEKFNIYDDAMFADKNVCDDMDLLRLASDLSAKTRLKCCLQMRWSEKIETEMANNAKCARQNIDASKRMYLCLELEQFKQQILAFTRVPRTIEQIRSEFDGQMPDLDSLSLFDYFCIFRESEIGLNMFEIESVANIHQIGDCDEDERILDLLITYFVSRRLDERAYINIEDVPSTTNPDADNESATVVAVPKQKEKQIKNEKDELDLDEFFQLSQMAAIQDADQVSETAMSCQSFDAVVGDDDLSQNVLSGNDNANKLFETTSEIKERCQDLLDSLCDKWIKGEDQYVIGDWNKITNGGVNLEYDGMIRNRGMAPKRLQRGVKRVWS